MPRPREPRSHFIVGVRVDEDGVLEIEQPAELFELEFTDDGHARAMSPVRIGEIGDEEFGMSELVGEPDDEG